MLVPLLPEAFHQSGAVSQRADGRFARLPRGSKRLRRNDSPAWQSYPLTCTTTPSTGSLRRRPTWQSDQARGAAWRSTRMLRATRRTTGSAAVDVWTSGSCSRSHGGRDRHRPESHAQHPQSRKDRRRSARRRRGRHGRCRQTSRTQSATTTTTTTTSPTEPTAGHRAEPLTRGRGWRPPW